MHCRCSQCSPGGEGSGGGGWLAVSWQAGGGAAAVRRRASAVSAPAARFVDRLSLASHRQTYVRPPCSATRASASCRWPRPRHVTARPDGRQGFRLLATRLQCVLLCVRAGDGEEGKPGTVKSGRKPSHHEPSTSTFTSLGSHLSWRGRRTRTGTASLGTRLERRKGTACTVLAFQNGRGRAVHRALSR